MDENKIPKLLQFLTCIVSYRQLCARRMTCAAIPEPLQGEYIFGMYPF